MAEQKRCFFFLSLTCENDAASLRSLKVLLVTLFIICACICWSSSPDQMGYVVSQVCSPVHSLTSSLTHAPAFAFSNDLIINEKKKRNSSRHSLVLNLSLSPLSFVKKQAGYELIDKKREK